MISRIKRIRYFVGLLTMGCLALVVFMTASADTVSSLTFNNNLSAEKFKAAEKIEETPTSFSCGDTLTDRDGYTYTTKAVGTQCWMAENLKTVTKPNGDSLTNQDDNSERDCISATGDERGTEADCEAGRTLYTLEAATDGSTDEGAQGLCPTNWHLPTDSDLHTLENKLKLNETSSCDADRIGSDCSDAGAKMLVGGSSGLNIDYTGLRYRDGHNSGFIGHNSLVILWSSTLTSPTTAYGRYIGDWNPLVIDRGVWGDGVGDNVQSASVRCVFDEPVEPVCENQITDRDGYTYSTVQIGDQCWMSQNLKTKTYPNGTCINGSAAPCSTASAADNFKDRSCYNNSEGNCLTDGALYSWYGAMNIAGDGANIGFSKPMPNPYTVWNNQQGICPTNWHIPTPDDFTTLARTVCATTGSGNCNVFPYGPEATGTFGTNEGSKLISGTANFNLRATGMRTTDYTTSMQKGEYGYLWGAAFNGIISNQAYRISVVQGPNATGVERKYTARWRNYPVRCIKNS